jgi:hypothetical protein
MKDANDVLRAGGRLSIEDAEPIEIPRPNRKGDNMSEKKTTNARSNTGSSGEFDDLEAFFGDAIVTSDETWIDNEPDPVPVLLEEPLWSGEGHSRRPDRWRGFMPQGSVCLLAGVGGIGKSSLLVDLALAVAAQGRWLGRYRATKHGKVIVVLAEESPAHAKRLAYKSANVQIEDAGEGWTNPDRKYDAESAAREGIDRITWVCLGGKGNVSLIENDGNGKWIPSKIFRWLKTKLDRIASSGDVALIIMDPLSRLGGPQFEVDQDAATQAVSMFELLTKLPGSPSVVVSHHANKSALSAAVTDQGSVRGASGLVDAARWVATVERVQAMANHAGTENRVQVPVPGAAILRVVKSNYTASGSTRNTALWKGKDDARKTEGWRGVDGETLELARKGMSNDKGLLRGTPPATFSEAVRLGQEKQDKAAQEDSLKGNSSGGSKAAKKGNGKHEPNILDQMT